MNGYGRTHRHAPATATCGPVNMKFLSGTWAALSITRRWPHLLRRVLSWLSEATLTGWLRMRWWLTNSPRCATSTRQNSASASAPGSSGLSVRTPSIRAAPLISSQAPGLAGQITASGATPQTMPSGDGGRAYPRADSPLQQTPHQSLSAHAPPPQTPHLQPRAHAARQG